MYLLFAVVCLLSALVTPGYAVSCIQCSTTSSNYCTGYTGSCASKSVCISIYEGSSIGSSSSYTFQRGCGAKKDCDKAGVFSVPTGKYRFSSTCCDSNNCTPLSPSLPDLNYTINGKTCPYCISSTTKDCTSNERMNCNGQEDKCALENTEITVASYTEKSSIRGCSTKGFCELGTQKSQSGQAKVKIEVKCGASTALSSAIMLFIVASASIVSHIF